MREILFRGKRVGNGKWIEGDLLSSGAYPDRLWITESKTFFDKQLQNIGIIEVDPATVGQYTGLQDKNGNKIFEGDIVHAITPNTSKNCLVKCERGQFCIGLCMPLAYVRNSSEVIGNIHDNPELLEVKRWLETAN